jgi:hypothetical protein
VGKTTILTFDRATSNVDFHFDCGRAALQDDDIAVALACVEEATAMCQELQRGLDQDFIQEGIEQDG